MTTFFGFIFRFPALDNPQKPARMVLCCIAALIATKEITDSRFLKEEIMKPTSKSTKNSAPVATGEVLDCDALTGLYMKGVERGAELQKKVLEVAAQQNAQAVEVLKKAVKSIPGVPSSLIFETAEQAFDRFVETQKNVIDMVVQQNAALVEATNERENSAEKIVANVSKIAQQSVERGIALQKSLLEFAAQQSKALTEAGKQFSIGGTPAAAAAEAFQKGMDTLFETQKDLLEAATKPLKAMAAKAR
jgi:hypothetical protein